MSYFKISEVIFYTNDREIDMCKSVLKPLHELHTKEQQRPPILFLKLELVTQNTHNLRHIHSRINTLCGP
jgi:hypothetical protein